MTTTAEALEAMTDRARFERLASAVLRRKYPELAALVHTGKNAKGETIPDPLDGLHASTGSQPPRFYFIAHTTTDPSGLRKKWIGSSDSDLVKVAEQAEKVRSTLPDAEFRVFLCTNQHCKSELVTEVYTWSAQRNLTTTVLEQSGLEDFLDDSADGHWIRQTHLGVKAQRLSLDLLRNLAVASRIAYRQQALFGSRVSAVSTQSSDELVRLAW